MKTKNTFGRILRSWWGRSIAGALVGGLLVAFSGIDSAPAFAIGMAAGAIILFFLGQLK